MRGLITYFSLFMLLLISFNCSAKKEKLDLTPRIRNISEWKPGSYHRKVELNVGWLPYSEDSLRSTDNYSWEVVKNDSKEAAGFLPIMTISYPDTSYTTWLSMDISDELLGKIIKQSLMTRKVVKKPLKNFIADASCETCHPESVRLPK